MQRGRERSRDRPTVVYGIDISMSAYSMSNVKPARSILSGNTALLAVAVRDARSHFARNGR